MKEYKTSQIRNVAFVGHGDSGKTAITEALLHINKLVDRLGAKDSGNTQSDYDPEEVKRKTSINTTLFPIETKEAKINVLDCPGYLDFIAEIRSTLRAADLAVVVVDAVSGVEVGTEIAWEVIREYNTPSAVFVNKMDKERADFDRALQSVRNGLGTNVVPVVLPIGKESAFEGVVDLIRMKACHDKGGKMQLSDIPAEMKDDVELARAALVEAAAEGDDALTEKFLMEEPLTDEEVVRGLHEAIVSGRAVPALCGCASQEIGIAVLQNFIAEMGPAPNERPGLLAQADGKGDPDLLNIDPEKPLVAFVFKTINDDFAGRLSVFKVVQGSLVSESAILNANRNQHERVAHVLTLFGKKNNNIHQLHAGDIGALSKLTSVRTNDTLIDAKGKDVRVVPTTFPPQTVFMAINPKNKGDEDKVGMGVHKMMEADPSINLERDSLLHQTVLSGMGETHLEVVCSRLKSSANVEVELKAPRINYRETITRKAQGQGRHKKQTGGRGQFGDCYIRLEPLPRGTGFEFVWGIVGGVIPSNYQKAVEKGVVEAMSRGIQAGYPAVDIRCAVYDGSYHAVDSSDLAFQLAAIKAFKNVSVQANPIIIEPIMDVKVSAPEQYMGDIMGSLSGKRGRISGSNSVHGKAIIEAQVPQAEMVTYSRELRSMTQGRGTFQMTFSHFEPTPPQIQEQIIASAEKQEEEED